MKKTADTGLSKTIHRTSAFDRTKIWLNRGREEQAAGQRHLRPSAVPLSTVYSLALSQDYAQDTHRETTKIGSTEHGLCAGDLHGRHGPRIRCTNATYRRRWRSVVGKNCWRRRDEARFFEHSSSLCSVLAAIRRDEYVTSSLASYALLIAFHSTVHRMAFAWRKKTFAGPADSRSNELSCISLYQAS